MFIMKTKETKSSPHPTALIAGVGPGLGAALVRRFAREGCRVAMMARSRQYLERLSRELEREGAVALPVPTDLTDGKQVARGFDRIHEKLGPLDILVHHASAAPWKGLLKLPPDEFEGAWRVTAYAAFLCCRHAIADMVKRGGGTVLFTGATSAVRGRRGAPAFSSAKFAARGLAESLAREFWPQGIHVAHVVIDGMIDTPRVRRSFKPKPSEPLLNPDHIAATYWHLAQQERSAWTLELDLRPHREDFFV